VGIPLSAERIKRTERATEAVKRRESKTAQMVPFSQVFYVDEEGKAHALDEWSEEICGHLLDLDGNVRGLHERRVWRGGVAQCVLYAPVHCG